MLPNTALLRRLEGSLSRCSMVAVP